LTFDLTLSAPLFIAAFFTSALAAVLGQGGGLMLMGVLGTTIPSHVIVPFHGIIQAASNSSRAFLALKSIQWPIITPILAGTVIGAVIIAPIIPMINWSWAQLAIGLFILWSVWGPSLRLSLPAMILGFFQGSLGILLGATGPLSNSYLLNKSLGKHEIVASNAVIMFVSHLIKVCVFLILGTQLNDYWTVIGMLCIAAIFGSFVGHRLRGRLNDRVFFFLFKAMLTLLALNMLITPLISV